MSQPEASKVIVGEGGAAAVVATATGGGAAVAAGTADSDSIDSSPPCTERRAIG